MMHNKIDITIRHTEYHCDMNSCVMDPDNNVIIHKPFVYNITLYLTTSRMNMLIGNRCHLVSC